MIKNDYKELLIKEGVLFKSKIEMYSATIPGFLKGLHKAVIIGKMYEKWVAKQQKKDPEGWDKPEISIRIQQQSVIGGIGSAIRKKQDINAEKYNFVVIDGDNSGASDYKNSKLDYIIDSFEVVLKK